MSIKPFSASLYAGTVASVGVLEDISLRALGRMGWATFGARSLNRSPPILNVQEESHSFDPYPFTPAMVSVRSKVMKSHFIPRDSDGPNL